VIERLLFTLLTIGFAAIKDDPVILEEIFGPDGLELDDTEVAGILQFFADKSPTVVHGYARANSEYPLVAIILGNDTSGDNWIGDFAGQVTDEESVNKGADCYSMGENTTYQLLCYSEHPDVTRYLYEVVKSILLTNIQEFVKRDVYDITVSGLDLMPDPRYIPEHLFVRQYTFACKREVLRIDKQSRLGKAFKVSGIHFDDPNNPIVGVSAKITVTGS